MTVRAELQRARALVGECMHGSNNMLTNLLVELFHWDICTVGDVVSKSIVRHGATFRVFLIAAAWETRQFPIKLPCCRYSVKKTSTSTGGLVFVAHKLREVTDIFG